MEDGRSHLQQKATPVYLLALTT